MIYTISAKTLKFNHKIYNVNSGPHGRGVLDAGDYEILVNNVVVTGLSAPYCAGGVCFFIPIRPKFCLNDRDGFGIHPDGNISGTRGCIGIPASDANTFWIQWMALPLNRRPRSLKVRDFPYIA